MLHLLESFPREGDDCLLKTEWGFTALTGSQGSGPSRPERVDEIAHTPSVAGALSFMVVIPLAIRNSAAEPTWIVSTSDLLVGEVSV